MGPSTCVDLASWSLYYAILWGTYCGVCGWLCTRRWQRLGMTSAEEEPLLTEKGEESHAAPSRGPNGEVTDIDEAVDLAGE